MSTILQEPTMSRFLFIPSSQNRKTGPIPVTYSTSQTRPSTCPLRGNGCYAESGPTLWQWRKCEQTGISLDQLVRKIKRLPQGTKWRHNVAGDLQGENDAIDAEALRRLTAANDGRRGFTYTHYPPTRENLAAIREANARGMTVNLSCDSPSHAAAVRQAHPDLPVTTLLPMNAANDAIYDGVRVVACPAEKAAQVNCSRCDMCALPTRDYVVGFRAHGRRRRIVNAIASDATRR
jgi:hypothetical protein